MGEMTTDKGVFKRKGSDVWQHRVYVPEDLQADYSGKEACRLSRSERAISPRRTVGPARGPRKCEREFEKVRAPSQLVGHHA